MHEIVTLQFGQQANYVGTHFWNAQESYFTYNQDDESPLDHDIHFRAGVGTDGTDTYTPRTVIYDLKGAFGTLRQDNALYQSQAQEDATQSGQWSGAAQVIREPALPRSEYQEHLDAGLEPPPLTTSSVRYWSDYNRIFYHPRSVVQLHEYELNSSLLPFERYATGDELFGILDKQHDLIDRDLRPFLEECDQLQGVQVLTSVDDAWGGFASMYTQRIRDELGKTSLWTWGLSDGGRKTRERQRLSIHNTLLSWNNLLSTSSLFVPLTNTPASLPSYLRSFDANSPWHTSALQVSAVESLTIPSRLRSSNSMRARLSDLEAVLSSNGQGKMAQLSFSATPSTSTTTGGTNGSTTSSNGDHHIPPSTSNGTHNAAPEAMDVDPSDPFQTLDISLLPTPPPPPPPPTPSSTSRPRPNNSRLPAPRVSAQILSLRGTFLSTLELDDLNSTSRDRRSRIAAREERVSAHQTGLEMNLPSSFPRFFGFSEDGVVGSSSSSSSRRRRREKVGAKAALGVGEEVRRAVKGWEGWAERVMGGDEREEVGEGLRRVAEGLKRGLIDEDESDEESD